MAATVIPTERRLADAEERQRILDRLSGRPTTPGPILAQVADRARPEYEEAFRHYLRGEMRGQWPYGLAEVGEVHISEAETRAQEVGSQLLGGFWVPESFQRQLVLAANDASPMRRVCAVVPTGDGTDMVWPAVDDTSVDGVLLAENALDTQTDASIGGLRCPAYMFHSRTLTASFQFVQDAGPQLPDYLAAVLGRRVARRENTAYSIGAAPSEPQGVVPAAAVGVNAAAAAGITGDELLDLIDSADSEWRFSDTAVLMMGSTTFSALRKLKTGEGAYLLWAPDPTGSSPGTLAGRKVVINKDMPAMASGNRSVVYFDTARFVIRDVVPAGLVVLRELFARNAQTGYMAFQKHGSVLQSVGAVPAAVCIVQAA